MSGETNELTPQWSDAELDQIQDFLGTVHGWKVGRVLSESDLSDILLYLKYQDVEGETATDAYHEGVAKGRRDTLSTDAVATMERIERLEGDLIVERATHKAMGMIYDQRADEVARLRSRERELVEALESMDAASRACPIMQPNCSKDNLAKCRKCGATRSDPCALQAGAEIEFINRARSILKGGE